MRSPGADVGTSSDTWRRRWPVRTDTEMCYLLGRLVYIDFWIGSFFFFLNFVLHDTRTVRASSGHGVIWEWWNTTRL
jgi:hypothetical protein